MHPVNGEDFVSFATEKPSIWSKLIGQQVTHTERGVGRIANVEQRVGYIPLIDICFENGMATFNSESLRNGKLSVFLDPSTASLVSEWAIEARQKEREKLEREKQQELERLEREELYNEKIKALKKIRDNAEAIFIPLAEKYNAPLELLWEDNNVTPLGSILVKLESGEMLETWEFQWLENKKLNRVLATVHFRDFNHSGELWSLVKTCKYLRKADLPNKVISITESVTSSIKDERLLSATLTTRGGAFRDLENLEFAKQSALLAIQTYPKSFHPHMLMGAILYQEGDPGSGDEYFAEAERLGANLRDKEFEIRKALNSSTPEARLKVIEYLFSKDPVKYAWVHSIIK